MSTVPHSMEKVPAVARQRVARELPEKARQTVRCRTMCTAEFATHWIWRNGEEHYTAAGMLMLAEAYDAEHDEPAAAVCRRIAEGLAGPVVVAAGGVAVAQGEDEFLARRWDLKAERGGDAS